jgi:hypothetical protein
MDEPDRLFERGSSLERDLISEGRAYTGAAELRGRTLTALGLASSAGLASAALVWLARKSLATKLLLAASAVTLLAGVPAGYGLLRRAAQPQILPAPSPSESASEEPRPVASPTEVPVLAAESKPPAEAPARTRASATNASSALRAELAALDAVRSTLASDDAAGALSFLAAYFRTFPRGRLHLEAEVLRIDALAQGGRRARARQYAKEFIQRNPNSVLTARVQPYAR